MADILFFSSKRLASAACATALLGLGGCASVIETPVQEMTAAQTVMPIAKPGTEMTAYALPTPLGYSATGENGGIAAMEAAVAGTDTSTINANAPATEPVTTLASAGASAATTAVPGEAGQIAVPAAAPAEGVEQRAELAATAVEMAVANGANPETKDGQPAAVEMASVNTGLPAGFMNVAVMEPGFDTGEPEGLEQLVENLKVVPVAKPTLQSGAMGTQLAMAQISQPVQKSGTPLDALISKYAALYEIPESLLHRVVKRESRYNPNAYSKGNYGLMQIRYNTARGLGYEGTPDGLFDAETNLKYGAKYLRGAWLVADDKNDGAVRLYASGYYFHAKRKGLLEETGLK
ncbi:transglycosylase SLT domain-containing protein [Sinorhizobium sp. BG8]|uniref:transglycosylase SLT domain-containing protein n=1 Tax=Sinorhizobium sp. BG8 TaxID=2613773 RepID=UPI00193E86DC|nr:transglycosylase SLT domain-containing protein [Sinorhizobium sp. BG8]QRM56003.1 transglycosylase SLT domain-containing protein [Sinorhizobium sp. BG8]